MVQSALYAQCYHSPAIKCLHLIALQSPALHINAPPQHQQEIVFHCKLVQRNVGEFNLSDIIHLYKCDLK